MREHIYKIEYHHIQIILFQCGEIAKQSFSGSGIVNLVVGKTAFTAVSFKLSGYQRRLIEVLALLAILIDPQFRKHPFYIHRHQTREYGIAGILRGCRQYGTIHSVVKREIFAEQRTYDTPLVETEIIYEHEKHLFTRIEKWKHFLSEYVGTHQRTTRILPVHP